MGNAHSLQESLYKLSASTGSSSPQQEFQQQSPSIFEIFFN
jgi:hypothetical protein